jgi:hypothetical protein
LVCVTAAAEPPVVTTTSPQAAAPGQSVSVTLRGQRLAGTTQLWTTFSPPTAPAAEPANNGQNDAECLFTLAVPAEASLGIHAMRTISPRGVSPLFPFLIDDLPTIAEGSENHSLAAAQEIPALCGVDGRVENLSRDFFKLPVQAGQKISFEVFARRLGSPLDASLYLYDSEGRILGYCDDAEGLSSDPQMMHTFSTSGVCIVEVRDIRYQGGEGHFYRLRVGDFPCVNCASPMSVRRGVESRVDFAGISVEDASPAFLTVPADWPHNWYPVSTKRANGASSGFAMVTVDDAGEVLDREPNNTQPQAQRIELGANINGRFDEPGDVDRFKFTATQGQKFLFTGVTRQQGSPTDLLLRMLDAAGNQIAAADDNGTAEGFLHVTFPASGEFTLEATDLNRRGGSQFAYRIGVSSGEPGFALSVSADTLNVPAGGVAALTVSAQRRDYSGPIELAVEGLPAGYDVPSTFLGPGINQVVLTVHGAKDVSAMLPSGLAVVGRATIGDRTIEARASGADALRTRWSNANYVSPRFTSELAIAPTPATALSLRVEPPTVVFGKNLTATAKVIVERGEGLDEAVALTVNPPQDGLPPNVALDLKPIEKGQQEATITFTANENVQLGPFTVVLNGTHQKDNVATIATTPGIGLRLEPPFSVTASPMSEPVLQRGKELRLKVAVQRNPAYTGDVKLSFEKLPGGISAAESTLAAGQSEVEVALAASADAPAASVTDVVLRATSPADAKITTAIPIPAFTVQ